jgi:Mrp family chromosome partitioning ATPase
MRAVVAHPESGLFLVTSGRSTQKPTELIGSDQMRRFIKTMEGTFTHIIFDSPPIAPCADSVILSSMVDGVLLVVHGGKTSRRVVLRSQQLIQDVGGRIFGVVLNNTSVTGDDHYYYSRRYSEYYVAQERLTDDSN